MTHQEALTVARGGQVKAAQEACLAALEDPECPVGPWTPVLELILKSLGENSGEELAWAALDSIETRLEPRQAIPHARSILRFFSKSEEFRTRAVDLYRKAYADVQGLNDLLEISGLAGGKPIRRAMQTLDICLGIQSGSFLVHRDEGPPAQVVDIDPVSWAVRLQTPKGAELIDPLTLGDDYEFADAHDFRVLSRFDPDGFKKQLRDDPGDIVVTIVKSRSGQMTSDELEGLLSPRYITSGAWSKWWSKVRAALRKNPHIQLAGRSPVIISYQAQAVSVEDTVWARFDVHQHPKTWLDLGQQYVRECRDKGLEVKTDFLRRLRNAVGIEAATLEKRKEEQALSGWLACAELTRLVGEEPDLKPAMRVLEAHGVFDAALRTLPNETFVGLALDAIRHCQPDDWPRHFVELLPLANPSRCDEMVELIKAAGGGEALQNVTAKIMSDPVAYASGLCWLYQGPEDAELFQPPPLVTLLTRLLSAIEQLGTLPPDFAREVRSRARTVLTARKYRRLEDCLDQIDEGMASALRTQLQRSSALTDAVVQDLLGRLRRRFPNLWTQPRKRRWEDTSVLFCTSPGKRSKEAELLELVNVKMKENARAIGEAAAHGDLSENSEYKFALEERDLLRARVAEIQSQLNMSEVLTTDDVPTNHVSVGTKVTLQNLAGGAPLTLTFLGPWEARVEEGILNYQAPISQTMMGRVLGDTVELDLGNIKGSFKLAAIEVGL